MPTLYTSDEIAAAAERIGLCEQVSALLGALESAESPRYSVSNAGNQGASYDGVWLWRFEVCTSAWERGRP